MALRDELIAESQNFAQAHGISMARLATIVMNRGSFFSHLKAGGDCNTAAFDRFMEVFANTAAWEAAKAADRARRGVATPTPDRDGAA